MMTTSELTGRVERLHALLNELYSKDPSWKRRGEWPADQTGSILYPPATDARIARREEQQGWKYPPSYRQFLALHNGWHHFWRDFTLVGVDGAHTDTVAAEVAEYSELQGDRWKQSGSVEAWEREERRHMYLPNHCVLAANFAGFLLVWDARTRRSDGEMDAVEWQIASGVRVTFETLPTFEAVLQWGEEGAAFALQNIKAEERKRERAAARNKRAAANAPPRKRE